MSKQVLVIEDDPDQRRLLERMLTAAGYRVATAPDGSAGLAAATTTRPDIILLDVMMPHMNGFQTCRALRENPVSASSPIIILTNKDEAADAFWAHEVGADAFLNKPIEVSVLLEAIERLTSSR